MRLTPATFTACPVRSLDAPGIRKELAEIAKEGMAAILGADQIAVLGLEFARVVGELYTIDREG